MFGASPCELRGAAFILELFMPEFSGTPEAMPRELPGAWPLDGIPCEFCSGVLIVELGTPEFRAILDTLP